MSFYLPATSHDKSLYSVMKTHVQTHHTCGQMKNKVLTTVDALTFKRKKKHTNLESIVRVSRSSRMLLCLVVTRSMNKYSIG